METNEVKPSFSLKYILLTTLITLITAGISIAISKLYESRPNAEVTVSKGYSINVIGGTTLPNEKFEVEFYFKENKRTKILSLFRQKIIIANTGNVGISDLEVTASLKDEDLTLIDPPKLETSPPNIIDAVSVTKTEKSTTKKHYWIISLLNPGESISFDYSAFSEKYLDSISMEVIPRKKDVSIKYEELSLQDKSTPTKFILLVLKQMLIILILPLILALPIYIYQWIKRPDYREKYVDFLKFYMEHKPWNLFKPTDK